MYTDQQLIHFLKNYQKIAIIGMSPYQDRPSNFVPRFLSNKGHEFIPIHPILEIIENKKVFKSLDQVKPIPSAVIIYMSQRNIDKYVSQAIDLKINLIWLPLGITSKLRSKAESKNIIFIEDRCPKIEWERLNL